MPTILDYVEITEGAGVVEVKAPRRMVGLTIAKTEIRKLHGVIVLALEKAASPRNGRRVVLVPGPDDVIEEGDVLVLFGSDQRLRQLDHSLGG
ncbi:MAG: cation:proton antiporter regulatory subunit [Kiritimatiellia bacterium]